MIKEYVKNTFIITFYINNSKKDNISVNVSDINIFNTSSINIISIIIYGIGTSVIIFSLFK